MLCPLRTQTIVYVSANLLDAYHVLCVQDFMRRLGVDLLIQAEEEPEDKDADQMQQRAVVCVIYLLLFLLILLEPVEMELEVLSLEINCNITGIILPICESPSWFQGLTLLLKFHLYLSSIETRFIITWYYPSPCHID